jgi:hypothetical protein
MKVILGFQKDFDPNIEWYWKKAADLIKWGTKSDYFHIEIAFDEKWIGAHTHEGIEVHELDINHRNPQFDYFELEIDGITKNQKTKFWEWMEGEAGSGYDWIGIYLTQFLFMDWESKDKWFCSEIVAKVLQMLYVDGFLDVKPNRLSPQDIKNILGDRLKPL